LLPEPPTSEVGALVVDPNSVALPKPPKTVTAVAAPPKKTLPAWTVAPFEKVPPP
jgi:hypothetical protein